MAGIVGDAINSNGDAVVFQAWRWIDEFTWTEWHIFLRDLEPEEMEPMVPARTLQASVDVLFQNGTAFARRPTISQDATRPAYGIRSPGEDIPNEQINFEDITRDAAGLRTITPGPAGAVGVGDGDSKMPMLSEDGGFVTFTSEASDLVLGDTNNVSDVFLADLAALDPGVATRRESVDIDGGQASGHSLNSDLAIKGDVTVVVFESDATDLIPSDTNMSRDIFERTDRRETAPFVRGDRTRLSTSPMLSSSLRPSFWAKSHQAVTMRRT